MSFTQTFSIVNDSNYALYLDQVGSNNLGDGDWPPSVAAKTTSPSFKQTGAFSVNPTAVYSLQGTTPPVNVYLHFYCVGVDPALHVNMTMEFSPAPIYVGSSISENNSDNGHSYETQAASSNNVSVLNSSTTGNGAARGEASFTIGAN